LHLDSPEEERIEYLHSIGQHYAEAVKIIDKAEHQVKLGVQLMSLNTVVREALRAIEQELSTDGIELDLRNSLRVTVRVNLWSIVEALVNLLSNAVEAMKKVQVRQLTVTTELSPDKTLACVYIHNTGRLIREKQIANFFQPEYTTKKGADHRGHGIPLAKKAIEIMGGRLELKPHSKGGIEAFVSLPVAGTSPKASAKGDVL
jgi:C4-dicarboxylate-specific signal transduction histidine kinase